MVKITQRFVPKKFADKVTFSGKNQNRTLTVHQTGNFSEGANAEMHARLQERGNSRNASWMFQSDDKEVIQSFPTSAQTWHAGDGNGDGNKHSISWEICVNRDADYKKSLEVAAKGIAKVLKEHKLGVSDLRQHHDWSGKNCPQQIRAGKEGITWNVFKSMVQDELSGKSVKPQTSKPKPAPSKPVTGGSVVNYMNSKGMDSSYSNRAKLAKEYGIANYKGTASQNIELLNKLKSGAPTKPTLKSNKAIAQEVIDGKWGNNPQRSQKLKNAGYNASAIQAEVNRILQGGFDARSIANQIKKGIDNRGRRIPNGHANRQRHFGLTSTQYAQVRRLVNK